MCVGVSVSVWLSVVCECVDEYYVGDGCQSECVIEHCV